MKVLYTGRQAEISDTEKQRAKRKLEKVHRILGASRNLEAHVILSKQRHLCEAEVTLRALHHTLVVSGHNAHPFMALSEAIEKLEKQAKKNKSKLVDHSRPLRQRDEAPKPVEAFAQPEAPAAGASEPAVAAVEVRRKNGMLAKPATVEEARIQLEEQDRDHVTFRDADTGVVCVLVRRRDGGLDLIEGLR